MKSIHRLNTLPDPTETHTMLEAEISYTLNRTGINALKIIINQFKELNSGFTKDLLRKEFIKQLHEIDEIFVEQQISEKQYTSLFEVVFSLDEDYQRTEIANFILDFADQLIIKIFKNIVILDEVYTAEVIESVRNYLRKKNQFLNIYHTKTEFEKL